MQFKLTCTCSTICMCLIEKVCQGCLIYFLIPSMRKHSCGKSTNVFAARYEIALHVWLTLILEVE